MKAKNINNYIFLLIPLFIFISCNEVGKEVYTKEAILKWQGYYAADGCGFFIEIDNKEYKPENEDFIGDEFQISGDISVIVKFKCSEKKIDYICGYFGHYLQMDGVKIISIEKI